MKCENHGCEMEWVELIDDPMIGDGYWFCQECWEDEEAEFQRSHEEDYENALGDIQDDEP